MSALQAKSDEDSIADPDEPGPPDSEEEEQEEVAVAEETVANQDPLLGPDTLRDNQGEPVQQRASDTSQSDNDTPQPEVSLNTGEEEEQEQGEEEDIDSVPGANSMDQLRLDFGFPTWAIIALSIIGSVVNPENVLPSVGFLYGFISGLMSFIPFIRQIYITYFRRDITDLSIAIGLIEGPPIVAHTIST